MLKPAVAKEGIITIFCLPELAMEQVVAVEEGYYGLALHHYLLTVGYDGSGGKSLAMVLTQPAFVMELPGALRGGTLLLMPCLIMFFHLCQSGPLSISKNAVVCSGSTVAHFNPSGKPAYSYTWAPSTGLSW